MRHSVEPVVVLRRGEHLGAEFAGQVGHPRADHGGLESRRLGDGPGGHVAAVGPAGDAQPIRVDDAARDQVVNTGQDIAKIVAAPVGAVLDQK